MPKELPSRRFWFATAATATLVVGSTLVAGAAVWDLPVLGFGQHADASESDPTETTKAPEVEPVPVEQIQFDDHFVRRGESANEGPGDQHGNGDPTVDTLPDGDDDGDGDPTVDTLPDSDDDSDDDDDGDDDGDDDDDDDDDIDDIDDIDDEDEIGEDD